MLAYKRIYTCLYTIRCILTYLPLKIVSLGPDYFSNKNCNDGEDDDDDDDDDADDENGTVSISYSLRGCDVII